MKVAWAVVQQLTLPLEVVAGGHVAGQVVSRTFESVCAV